MPFKVLNAVGSAQTNTGISAALQAYINQEYNRAQSLRTQMRIDSRTSAIYNQVEKRITTSISTWTKMYGTNSQDNTVYYTGDIPYKKNGDILVVVTNDSAPIYDGSGNLLANQPILSPFFDNRFNRIVLTKKLCRGT